MRKGDLFLILGVLLTAAILYFFFFSNAQTGGIARVTVDGEIQGEYPLSKYARITVENDHGSNTFEIKGGLVNMVDADCRDQICVEHKTISYTGEVIVCLPHKMIIEIVDTNSSPFDVVVG